MMHKALISTLIWLSLFANAGAQQPARIPRIGYIAGSGASVPDAFVKKLRDLGYVDGKNFALELQARKSAKDDWAELVAPLIKAKVDLIVADGSGPASAAAKATKTIPIVMTSSTDPVGIGLVASLAQPGGNVTGLSSVSGELGGKLLEIMKEIMPRLNRVVIAGPSPTSPTRELFIKETTAPARALKIELIQIYLRGPEDYAEVFHTAAKRKAQGLLVRIPPNIAPAERRLFVNLAAKHRLPAIYQATNWIEEGGLLSYGADRNHQFQRAAVYVDKILKGAKPADLPVSNP